ncbi:ABC transporter permease [Candidatus Contubernalis alkalaceticus]|nr:ABC transporter permease [Candidatus Contubernalis alkalaceticus]
MIVAGFIDIPVGGLISDSLVRLVMNGVLVLSMVPMLNAGLGINYGLPVGIVAGLLGMSIAVNFNFFGIFGFLGSIIISLPIAVLFGMLYAKILEAVKGREEIAGIFIGFSLIYLMSFFWAVAPFTNPQMLYPIGGQGMRPTIGLSNFFGKSLNELWLLNIRSLTLPLGMLIFFVLLCLLVYLFFKTKVGMAITAVGENETFARLSGIDIRKMRTLAVIISTVLGAAGICVYAQSYGFLELYNAPLMMAFPAASAVLIGGARRGRTTVLQVVAGAFLFQSIYVFSTPLANRLMVPEASEIMRVMITNMVILYALLYEGGRAKIEKN